MKPLIAYNSIYLRYVNPFGMAAVTLYPVILFKWKREEVQRSHIFRHEMQHFYQGQKYGWLRFFLYYLRGMLGHGYKGHPMEKGADNHEREALTPEEAAIRDGKESRIARIVDIVMSALIPGCIIACGYAIYRMVQG